MRICRFGNSPSNIPRMALCRISTPPTPTPTTACVLCCIVSHCTTFQIHPRVGVSSFSTVLVAQKPGQFAWRQFADANPSSPITHLRSLLSVSLMEQQKKKKSTHQSSSVGTVEAEQLNGDLDGGLGGHGSGQGPHGHHSNGSGSEHLEVWCCDWANCVDMCTRGRKRANATLRVSTNGRPSALKGLLRVHVGTTDACGTGCWEEEKGPERQFGARVGVGEIWKIQISTTRKISPTPNSQT